MRSTNRANERGRQRLPGRRHAWIRAGGGRTAAMGVVLVGTLLGIASPGRAQDSQMDLFPEHVLRRVVEQSLQADAAARSRTFDLSCESLRRRLDPVQAERRELWRRIGSLPPDDCRDPGAADPERGLTTSEKLARRYPPKRIKIFGLVLHYEPYPVGPLPVDALGYPVYRTFSPFRVPIGLGSARDMALDHAARLGHPVPRLAVRGF